MIYLDNAATTQIDGAVLDEMLPYMTSNFGNAGTIYKLGRDALKAIDTARERVASLLHCQPDQIIFTSGGTEGNNMVIRGLVPYLKVNGKNIIVSSMGEHDSVINAEKACIKDGFYTRYLPIIDGIVEQRDLYEALSDGVGLVSVMFVNNELGTVNPVNELAYICSKRGIFFHTDCVQAAGDRIVDVNEIGCDFATISSHKIHGPKGVGAVFAKDNSAMSPLICGGNTQEFGLRGGTENVAGIVGFGKACEITNRDIHDSALTIATVKQKFYNVLYEKLKEHGLEGIMHVNGNHVVHYGKILNLRFDGVDGATLVLAMDSKGVYISAGSACHSQEMEPSRVLLAAGLSPEEARSSVRISFSKHTTAEDAENAARLMASVISVLAGGK